MKNIQSKLGTLNIYDFLKGLLVAVLSGVVAVILPMISSGNFDIDWKLVSGVAISSALGYLSLKLGTNSNGDILTSE